MERLPKRAFGWITRSECEDVGIKPWAGVAFRRLDNRDMVFVAPIPLNFILWAADWLYWRVAFPSESVMKRKAMSIIARDRMLRGYQPRICSKCGNDWEEDC